MPKTVDARGMRCPLPYIKAKHALESLPPGEELIVLADDPDAPVDIAALAADAGLELRSSQRRGEWELRLVPG